MIRSGVLLMALAASACVVENDEIVRPFSLRAGGQDAGPVGWEQLELPVAYVRTQGCVGEEVIEFPVSAPEESRRYQIATTEPKMTRVGERTSLSGGSVKVPRGPWCVVDVFVSGKALLQGTRGGAEVLVELEMPSFSAALDEPLLPPSPGAQAGYLVELGGEQWLTAVQGSLDADDPAAVALVEQALEDGGLFLDEDGDGELSAAERAAGPIVGLEPTP